MARIAARISQGWRAIVDWKERAVPWKEPTTLAGTPIFAIVCSMASPASESATPSGRLNEIGEAANWPWWFTESGVLLYS